MAVPSWNLEPNEFRSALLKGLGRAVLHAREHPLSAEHQEALRAACLEPNHWFNSDEEAVPWLLDIVDLAGMRDVVAGAVLAAVSHEGADHHHLCALLHGLDARGISGAKDALYEVFRRTVGTEDIVPGWSELLELDGWRVFERVGDILFADEQRLLDLLDYPDDAPRTAAREALDKVTVPSARRNMLATAIEAVEAKRAAPKEDRAAILRAMSAADVLEAVRTPSDRRAAMIRGWSRVASEPDLVQVAEAMFAEQSADRMARLLMGFSARSLPTFDERFLALAEHEDEKVRHRALRALGNYGHPKVRDLALRRLSAGDRDGNTINLFRLTYQPGDHVLFEPLFADVEDPDEMHDRGYDLLEVYDQNRVPECSALVLRVYAATPCSFCRERAVKILVEQHLAPDWMIEECGNDAYEEIRRLVAPDEGDSSSLDRSSATSSGAAAHH